MNAVHLKFIDCSVTISLMHFSLKKKSALRLFLVLFCLADRY